MRLSVCTDKPATAFCTMHNEQTDTNKMMPCRPDSGDNNGCGTGCKTCQALRTLDEAVPASHYVLGGIWVFLVPLLGLIAGCAVASAWSGEFVLQTLAVIVGLAGGLAGGVLGRRLTLPGLAREARQTVRGRS